MPIEVLSSDGPAQNIFHKKVEIILKVGRGVKNKFGLVSENRTISKHDEPCCC